MKVKLILFTLLIPFLFGCVSVTEYGSQLSQQVGTGIDKISADHSKTIKAIGDIERTLLDEKWEQIYQRVEAKYIKKHSLDVEALTIKHRESIAATAAYLRQELLKNINEKEAVLLKAVNDNRDTVLNINDSVTEYLLSQGKVKAERDKIKKNISDISGVDLDNIVGTVKKSLNITK